MVRFLTVLCLLCAIVLAGCLIMERLKVSIVIAPCAERQGMAAGR